MKRMFILIALLAPTPMMAKDVIITQKDKTFSSQELTLAPGDHVIFKNDDDTAHNVFATGGAFKFNLGIQKPGVETKHTFNTVGSSEIRCAIHPKMKLKVTVK